MIERITDPNIRVVVVAWHMRGCTACAEYMPRFERMAGRFARVPSMSFDAEHPANVALAKRHKIDATPITVVQRRLGGEYRSIGAVDDAELEYMFRLALSVA